MGSWRVLVRKMSGTIALLACVMLAAGCAAGGSVISDSHKASEVSSTDSDSSAETEGANETASSNSPASIEDMVEITNSQIEQDSIGRYVLTATISNSGEEAVDVELDAKVNLTTHETNKYGEEEEFTTIENVREFDSVTPWVSGDNSIEILGLEAGEKREISIYPAYVKGSISLTKYTIDDPQFTVANVKRTSEASKLSDVPDFNGDLQVDIISFNGTRVSGTVTNNTGKYLTSVSLTFTKWDSNGLPVASTSLSNMRPIGAALENETLNNLKPGAVSDFEVYLGDCNTVKVKDVYYDVDQAKS